jgi:hypothetical protein
MLILTDESCNPAHVVRMLQVRVVILGQDPYINQGAQQTLAVLPSCASVRLHPNVAQWCALQTHITRYALFVRWRSAGNIV